MRITTDKQLIISGLLLASLCGCLNRSKKNEKQKDDFYAVTSDWDMVRVPLIKPYVVTQANPDMETSRWSIKFFHSLGTYNVKRVDVKADYIYILSGKVDEKNDSTLVNLQNVPTGWYVIDTKKKTEKGFAGEEEFKTHIKENNYPAPQWHDIDSLLNVFSDKGKLPWIPE